jgi:4-amino-4-deoxy-L-arabinose transferase-like glycosyltransferase
MGRPSWILRLTLLGLGARLLFVALEPQAQLVGDEHTWTAWGMEVAGAGFSPLRSRLIFYPPVYPYFIATFYALSGWLGVVKVAQAALGALLIPALGRIGTLVFGARVGVTAAAIAALYPDLVWFSAHFWSETVFVVLLAWAFERLIVAGTRAESSAALTAGLLFGLATLTRETALYFVPLAGLWLAIDRGRTGALGRGAAFVLAAMLSIAPWSYRNWVAYDAFVPVSTSGGLNLWQGNARLTREEVYALYEQAGSRIERYRYARRMGVQAILERQPGWIFEKLRDEMPRFWEADSLALAHIRREAYGPVPSSLRIMASVLFLAPYLALIPLFAAGVAGAPLDRNSALLGGFLVYYNLLHVVSHGFARYRLPALIVVFAFAAFAIVAWREGRYPRLTGRRLWLAGAVLVLLSASVLPSLLETQAGDEPSGAQAPSAIAS